MCIIYIMMLKKDLGITDSFSVKPEGTPVITLSDLLFKVNHRISPN